MGTDSQNSTNALDVYTLAAGEAQIALEEPETFEALFYDLFSETCSYLEQRGFQVEFQVQWVNEKTRIYTVKESELLSGNWWKKRIQKQKSGGWSRHPFLCE